MDEVHAADLLIEDAFWSPRLQTNARRSIDHQWEQLEATGCIDNFRLAAGELQGFRRGWFFADSDAYKWLDAACRIQATLPSARLGERIAGFLGLLERAQQADGYLYTYNQAFFPGERWTNLQVEHEFYCLGHLIEAGIAHEEVRRAEDDVSAGRPRPSGGLRPSSVGLRIACRAADLLVRELAGRGPEFTDGHEEIEVALLRLADATGVVAYRELAEQLLERRGRIPRFWGLIQAQNRSSKQRSAHVERLRRAYLEGHREVVLPALPPGNAAKRTRLGRLRYLASALSGRLLQQHRPIRRIREPVGHAVRFAYLETAATMLARQTGDRALRSALEAAWDRMVRRRMSVTGGVGNLPEIEGFGRDYELDPEVAYNETCAALGCLFWNWEMALFTGQARYSDLFEWQLYNAASVGMGADGTSYLYNNPLACRGAIERRSWFEVPCCPSNLSRTWAALGRYQLSHEGDQVWVHQYPGCRIRLDLGAGVSLRIESGLPWEGRAAIYVEPAAPQELELHLRIPSWTRGYRVSVNEEPCEPLPLPPDRQTPVPTACGYAPHGAFFVPIRRSWRAGDRVRLELPMPIAVLRPDRRVTGSRGRAAITRGPLVYCLESVDNAGVDLFEVRVDLATLQPARSGEPPVTLSARSADGQGLTFIPYYAWGNRGPSQMNVLVRV